VELLVTTRQRGEQRVNAGFGPTQIAQRIQTTMNPNAPVYYVDSISARSPDYLAAGAGIIQPESKTLLDLPGFGLIEQVTQDQST
jgi:hypothetical protein